jgi:septal ring factor EnvC (AmiA/AmiB activator)
MKSQIATIYKNIAILTERVEQIESNVMQLNADNKLKTQEMLDMNNRIRQLEEQQIKYVKQEDPPCLFY